MGISDSEFNAYYSIKSLSSIIPPIVMTIVSGKTLNLKTILLSLALFCAIGQALFALGLTRHN